MLTWEPKEWDEGSRRRNRAAHALNGNGTNGAVELVGAGEEPWVGVGSRRKGKEGKPQKQQGELQLRQEDWEVPVRKEADLRKHTEGVALLSGAPTAARLAELRAGATARIAVITLTSVQGEDTKATVIPVMMGGRPTLASVYIYQLTGPAIRCKGFLRMVDAGPQTQTGSAEVVVEVAEQ
jgi:hypothetical protein